MSKFLLTIGQSSIELGLIYSLTVLALFLSYKMLNICDLSTDGCFSLGACVSASFVLMDKPLLAIIMGMLSGFISGFILSILQTKLKINSLLAGIIVNTGLYSINIAILKGSPLVSLNNHQTIFSYVKQLLQNTLLFKEYKLIIILVIVTIVALLLHLFLKTKLGLTIRATGNNPTMVANSSINPDLAIIIGLILANGLTALSGCLMAQYSLSASVDLGSGVLTIALASLLIGCTIKDSGPLIIREIFAILGAIIFRLIYALALRIDIPSYMLKLISAIIVTICLSLPFIIEKYQTIRSRNVKNK